MISPLAGYGAKGAIWYQGESNANRGSATAYEELLGCMIKDWRTRWGSDLVLLLGTARQLSRANHHSRS